MTDGAVIVFWGGAFVIGAFLVVGIVMAITLFRVKNGIVAIKNIILDRLNPGDVAENIVKQVGEPPKPPVDVMEQFPIGTGNVGVSMPAGTPGIDVPRQQEPRPQPIEEQKPTEEDVRAVRMANLEKANKARKLKQLEKQMQDLRRSM